MRIIPIILLLLAGSLLPIQAISVGGYSLEWLADHSESIGIYKIADIGVKSEKDATLRLTIDRAIKGSPPKEAKSDFLVGYKTTTTRVELKSGQRFLLFLDHSARGPVEVVHLINLEKPESGGLESLAITAQFVALTQEARILSVVQARVSKPGRDWRVKEVESPPNQFRVEVPTESTAFKRMYHGSACFLYVPSDLRHAAQSRNGRTSQLTE